jgi:L-lactate dehydrogenase complex protein LldG
MDGGMSERAQRPTTPRDVILERIRTALKEVAHDEYGAAREGAMQPPEPVIPRAYRQTDNAPRDEIIARFVERIGEYKATVRATTTVALPREIAMAVARHGVERLVVPPDLPTSWLPAGVTVLRDEPPFAPLTNETLDTADGVLTACALGIAQTGTIVLDAGPGQGRRALSLIPDYHLCVVRAEQIVGIVPEAIAALASQSHRPLTFISGPSATSDIELNRVEGVHGPRTLEVLVVAAATGPEAEDTDTRQRTDQPR